MGKRTCFLPPRFQKSTSLARALLRPAGGKGNSIEVRGIPRSHLPHTPLSNQPSGPCHPLILIDMSDLSRSSAPRSKRVPAPHVFPPYPLRQALTLLISSPQLALAILPSPPSWLSHLKTLVYILLLVNIGSFPLRWHYNLFKPVIATILRARPYIPLIRGQDEQTTSPKTGRKLRLEAIPLGKDIFEEKVWLQCRATPDDCEYVSRCPSFRILPSLHSPSPPFVYSYLMHLSNSSYLSRLDEARSALLFPHFFRLYTDGARLHLGGSSLTHHKEIPIMARYEIRVQVAAWDEKWFYLVARFTSPTDPETHRSRPTEEPTSAGGGGTSTPRSPGISLSRSARDLRELLRDVARPEHEAKAKTAKENGKEKSKRGKASSQQSLSMSRTGSVEASSPTSPSRAEPTLYATVVSRYCAKYNRKTIPPWLVVASSGFGTWASTRANWDKAETCRERYASGARRLALARRGSSSGRGIGGTVKPNEAFLSAFDPQVAKTGAAPTGPDSTSSSAGSPAGAASNDWMHPTAWSLVEWEARRQKGLEEVAGLGGLAPSAPMGGQAVGRKGTASGRATPAAGSGVGKSGYFE